MIIHLSDTLCHSDVFILSIDKNFRLVFIMNNKLESRIARLEKYIKDGYHYYDIDEASESIYNDIKALITRISMHIDELKVEHIYDQASEWQSVLQDMRDLKNKINNMAVLNN